MEMVKQSKRVEYLDIAKGLGIILVVWAHAKGPFSGYIYQFHMPLFFLISGYLFNARNSFRQFLTGKVKSIYIPFVMWNLLAVGIKTVLNSNNWEANAKQSLEILLTLSKDGRFFGATWFLGALFMVSVLYKFLDVTIQQSNWKRPLITGLFAAMAVMGFEINLPYMLSRTLILGMFYAAGFLVKEYQEKLHPFDRPPSAVLAFLIFVVIGRYNSANMGKNEYRYPFSFVFGALLASYCLISTSRLMQDSSIRLVRLMKRGLCYLGKKSIDIVIWQFVAFRLVIVLQLWMNGEPISDLLLYYPVYSASNGWWIVYTIVGCAVPIWWGNMYHGMWRAVKAAARKLSVS